VFPPQYLSDTGTLVTIKQPNRQRQRANLKKTSPSLSYSDSVVSWRPPRTSSSLECFLPEEPFGAAPDSESSNASVFDFNDILDPVQVASVDFPILSSSSPALDLGGTVTDILGPSSSSFPLVSCTPNTPGSVEAYFAQKLPPSGSTTFRSVTFSIFDIGCVPEHVASYWTTLLDYFFTRLSTIVFVCAIEQNELVRVMAPMAVRSKCVFYSLLAWSANHLQQSGGEQWQSVADTLTKMALCELRDASTRHDRQMQECALGGWLILCAIEVCGRTVPYRPAHSDIVFFLVLLRSEKEAPLSGDRTY
jgi:hypothetical protein